jgi:hypothetical protein
MSAFICGQDHIKALAVFAVGKRYGSMRVAPNYFRHDYAPAAQMDGRGETDVATFYANILYCENVRSVQSRYSDCGHDDLPGPISKPEMLTVTTRDVFELGSGTLRPLDILKMCDCLEYQSCETDDYRETPAFKLLDRIRGAAIHALPGYDDAPWDWQRPAPAQRRRVG